MGAFELTPYELSQPGMQQSASRARWFAVQTRPRFEKKAARELEEKGVEAFLPCHASLRQWSDRRCTVHTPLFPGYVFVNTPHELDARVAVLRTSGVMCFVGIRGVATPIPEEEIIAIKTLEREKVPFEPYPFLEIGERVRICGGSLDGIKGILTGIRGDQSLVISVDLIQKSIALRVSGYRVEAI